MDKLEHFILTKRFDFDSETPGKNVWIGIQKQLHQGKRINWVKISLQVAAGLVLFVSGWFVNNYTQIETQKLGNNLHSQVLPEVQKAEQYYTPVIDNKMKQIEVYLKKNPELKEEIQNDFMELDSTFVQLKKDLNDGVRKKEILEAMIQNYQIKLQILDQILASMKQREISGNEIQENGVEL